LIGNSLTVDDYGYNVVWESLPSNSPPLSPEGLTYYKSLKAQGPTKGFPLFLHFLDPDNPKTMEIVDPHDFAKAFGEGVSLKEVTIQMTNDPVTWSIDKVVPWLPCLGYFANKPFRERLFISGLKSRPREEILKSIHSKDRALPSSCSAYTQKWEAYDNIKFEEVLSQLRPLAERGDAESQYKLAEMYSLGEGVEKDDAQAVIWYRRAADQGYSKAQNALAARYSSGRGVTQDYAEALYWTLLTRKTGGSSGMSPDKIIKVHQFTTEQVDAIKKRVNEWVPTPGTPKL
jgi:hypothetical protein